MPAKVARILELMMKTYVMPCHLAVRQSMAHPTQASPGQSALAGAAL